MAEVERWITINGNHIPILSGESRTKAISKYAKGKRNKAWSKKYRELQESEPNNDARARHGKYHIETTDNYIKSKIPKIKGIQPKGKGLTETEKQDIIEGIKTHPDSENQRALGNLKYWMEGEKRKVDNYNTYYQVGYISGKDDPWYVDRVKGYEKLRDKYNYMKASLGKNRYKLK